MLLLLLLQACAGSGEKPDDTAPADADTDTDADTDADSDTDTDTDTDTNSADADGDGALPSVDCDDTDPAVHPGAEEACNEIDDDCDGEIDEGVATTVYTDADGDGYGDADAVLYTGCTPPDSGVADATDCDDTDADVHPGAAEPDCTDPTDYDCDGATDYADEDGDGAAACEDCDDADDSVFPGAAEDCDGVDDDCDGTADEGAEATWYGDADADGYGGSRLSVDACEAPYGFVSTATDCDDLDEDAFPGADERCDGADDDCDGDIDEDAVDPSTFYVDDDGDGYGDPASPVRGCEAAVGEVDDDTDCDDSSATIHPDAPERCDGIDHDCDGATDESDATDAATWYLDADADGYGDAGFTDTACTQPSGFVADDTDCDDRDADASPAGTETCDGDDDDCDGTVDESGATGETTWYRDADSDGFGNAAISRSSCTAPSGYVADDEDCDDTRSTVSPDGSETCNDLDDDCDGTVDDTNVGGSSYYVDADDDGFGSDSTTAVVACDAPAGYRLDNTDCDDGDIEVHPYAWEDTNNLVDDDCDGLTDTADTDTRRYGPTGNDQGSTVNLTGMTFPFCGTDYTAMYMQSNGRITFGSNDTDATETAVDFAADTTVAAAWDDLRSSGTSSIEWMEHDHAVGFYWIEMPEGSGSGTNTFSILLFDDGRIFFQYETMGMSDGLVGWSCAPGSVGSEVDLSAAMAAVGAGSWGYGTGTEDYVYEIFGSDNDLDDSVLRLCGNPDGSTNPCEE